MKTFLAFFASDITHKLSMSSNRSQVTYGSVVELRKVWSQLFTGG